jgi:hypothetical protein
VILRALKDLSAADDLEVLMAAKELLAAVKAPLEDVKASQSAEAAEQSDFLGKSGGKALEERHKRELTSREREGIAEDEDAGGRLVGVDSGNDRLGHGHLRVGLDDVDGGLRNREVLEVRYPVGFEPPCQ